MSNVTDLSEYRTQKIVARYLYALRHENVNWENMTKDLERLTNSQPAIGHTDIQTSKPEES